MRSVVIERHLRNFFVSESAEGLAAFRVFFYLAGFVFAVYAFPYLSRNEFPEELFRPAIFAHLTFVQPPYLILVPLYLALLLGLLAAAAGIFSFASRAVVFLLAFYLFGFRYNYSFLHEWDGGFIICLFLMIFAPCADALSLDHLRRRRRGHLFPPRWTSLLELRDAGYGWPLNMIRLYWIFLCSSAGILKLRNTGISWATQNAVNTFLLRQVHYDYPAVHPLTGLAHFLSLHPNLSLLGSYVALGIETAMPLALLGFRTRLVMTALMVGCLILFQWTFGYGFYVSLAPLYISVLPWSRIAPRLRRFVDRRSAS
jgi:hypothetical protein